MTGNKLFQSVSVFQIDIYILKQVKKNITALVYMLQEMKAATKNNSGLGVHLVP